VLRVLGQQVIAEQRNDDHRGQPRQQQRDRGHLENRARIFAGTRLGQCDRQESGHRDQRAGQHRKRRAGVGERGGTHPAPALLQFYRHHLDRDDRIVHQQPQSQNQRAERHLVQADAEQLHEQRRGRQHERNGDHHHHAGAHSQAQQTHQQHDRDRFGHRLQEVVDRMRHRARHARDFSQFQSRRQALLQ
jgi:hypothetical protein